MDTISTEDRLQWKLLTEVITRRTAELRVAQLEQALFEQVTGRKYNVGPQDVVNVDSGEIQRKKIE